MATPSATAAIPRVRLVLILGALSAFAPLSLDLYLPGLPGLTRGFGANAWEGQLTLTACVIGLALGQIVAGPLSDRLGRRPPLLLGLAAYCGASLACAVAPSVWALVGLRFLQGLAGAAGIVVARAVVRDLMSGAAAARLFSTLMLVTGLAPILAPVVGGQLLRATSWRGLFVTLAIIGAMLLLAAAVGLEETLPLERRTGGDWRETTHTFHRLLRDRVFLGYALVGGFAFGELFGYIAGSPFVLQGIYGISPPLFGAVFGVNAFGLVACAQVNGALVGRISPERLLAGGLAVAASAGSSLLVLVLVGGAGLVAILPCFFALVASLGFIVPNAAALALDNYPHAAGSASALLGMLQFLIGAAAAPFVGVAGADSAVPLGVVVATLGAGAVGALFFARRAAAATHRERGGTMQVVALEPVAVSNRDVLA